MSYDKINLIPNFTSAPNTTLWKNSLGHFLFLLINFTFLISYLNLNIVIIIRS